MDELEISGKRYISSRRAAKEHKYHSDYIGQLIRAGKVAGTKVGRAWYVDEASLAAYLDSEDLRSTSASVPVAASIAVNVEESKSVPVRAKTAHIETLSSHEPLKHERPKTGGLRYISDEEPLFMVPARRPALPRPKADIETYGVSVDLDVSLPRESRARGFWLFFLLIFVGILSGAVFFASSFFLQYTVSVGGAEPQAGLVKVVY